MTLRSMAARVSRLALAATLVPAVASAQLGGTIIQPGQRESISRVATRGAAFLSLGVGARPLALAGAAAPLSGDLSMLYWNVGALGDVRSVTAFASHEKLFGQSGLTNTFAGAALPLFGGAAAVSFTSFSSGDIERTTEDWPEGGDPTFGSLVSWSAMAVGVHYGRLLTDRLSVGVTLKAATEGIEFAKATYYGGDVGVRFRSGLFGSTLGFSLANIGSAARIDGPATQRRVRRAETNPQFPTSRPIDADLRTEKLQLPTAIRIGVQTDLLGTPEAVLTAGGRHRVLLLTEVTDAIDTEIMPAVAAEYGFHDRIFFRGGMRFLNESRVDGDDGTARSLGGGIKLPVRAGSLLFDYAYRQGGDLEGNHLFSFQFGF